MTIIDTQWKALCQALSLPTDSDIHECVAVIKNYKFLLGDASERIHSLIALHQGGVKLTQSQLSEITKAANVYYSARS